MSQRSLAGGRSFRPPTSPLGASLSLVLLAFLLAPSAQADASALAECGPGQEKVVVSSDAEGRAAAACAQGGWIWPWVAGAGAGIAVGLSWSWLAWLRWLPAMGLFTRLRNDRLLDNPLRAQIMDLVESEPGIHYQAIIERTGRGKGSIAHHLSVLVRGGLLSSVSGPGHRSFFIKGRIDVAVMRGLAVVKSDTGAAVLHAVARRPGANKRSVARELGCSESAVRYHLRRFEDAGLVSADDGLHVLPAGENVLDFLPEPISAPTRPPGLMA